MSHNHSKDDSFRRRSCTPYYSSIWWVLALVILCATEPHSFCQNRLKDFGDLEHAQATVSATSGKGVDFDYYSLDDLTKLRFITTSSGFFPVEVSSSPAYAEIISEDMLRDSTGRTLSDFIDGYVPGMQVGRHLAFGSVPGVRGSQIDSGSKTFNLYNGISFNPRQGIGYGHLYDAPLLLDLSRIEIIHGPGAIRYGAGAVNGVINSISKTGATHPGLETRIGYGHLEELGTAEFGFGTRYGDKEDQNVYLYFGAYYADGYKPDNDYGEDLSTVANESARHALGYEDNNYRGSLNWQHGNFDLKAVIMDTTPYKNGTQPFHSPTFRTRMSGVMPSYYIPFSDDSGIKLEASLVNLLNAHNPMYQIKDLTQRLEEDHYNARVIYTSSSDLQDLAVGAEAAYKNMQTLIVWPGEFVQKNSTDDVRRIYSLFIDDTVHLLPELDAAIGLRYDYHDYEDYGFGNVVGPMLYFENEVDPHVSPRASLSYKITSASRVNMSYQHGFRTPTSEEFRYTFRTNAIAQFAGLSGQVDTVKPETIDSLELSFHHELTDSVTTSINLFDNHYQDNIGWAAVSEENSPWTAAQIADMIIAADTQWGSSEAWLAGHTNSDEDFHNRGVDLSVKWLPKDKSNLRVTYSYAKTDRDVDKTYSQYYPRHMVKIYGTWYVSQTVFISANYAYGSGIDESDIAALRPVADTYRDPRHQVNLAMGYSLSKDIGIKMTVINVFEEDPPPSINTPQMGGLGYGDRRYYLSLDWRF